MWSTPPEQSFVGQTGLSAKVEEGAAAANSWITYGFGKPQRWQPQRWQPHRPHTLTMKP